MNEEECGDYICPLMSGRICVGSKCMFWIVDGKNKNDDDCAITKIIKRLK